MHRGLRRWCVCVSGNLHPSVFRVCHCGRCLPQRGLATPCRGHWACSDHPGWGARCATRPLRGRPPPSRNTRARWRECCWCLWTGWGWSHLRGNRWQWVSVSSRCDLIVLLFKESWHFQEKLWSLRLLAALLFLLPLLNLHEPIININR